ncbi:MMPL family transporter [Nocardioides KLBMP 9356]|uniref:MMPL family transporter n=1 Tax=Nocardioides potassii TaxID=2911371 RepID=A0ABS9HCJ1_9ACTN|nr:MMPL family transporter [Nocardioides potassii]MCF6377945.1 MMPL family transporter [Nocardioides potassii]
MLERTGPWLHRHHRAVLALWAVLVVAGAVLGGSVFDRAADVGPRPGAESTVVGERLDRLETEGEQVLVVLSGTDPLDPATSEKTAEVVFALREVKGVVDLRDPWTTNAYDLVAEDRTSAAVEVELDPALSDEQALATADDVVDLLRRAPFPHVAAGGDLLAERTFTDQAVSDAAIGEGVALVVLLALLVLARGNLAAGLVPVGAALASVALALLALSGLAGVTPVSDFAVNVVTVLGLALCVDYCLLLLHRYVEERGAGTVPAPDALARTMATAGRTVVVSGLTVGASIGALLLLGDPLLDGLAVGGVVAVLAVTVTALTLGPALLVACDRWLPEPDRGVLGRPSRPREEALLPRFARLAQARPWPVLLASCGVLVLLATPLLGLRLGASDARSLPPGSEAREVIEVIESDYPDIATAPIDVLADAPSGDPALERMAARMAELPDVKDVVLLSGLPDGWSRWIVTPVGPTSGEAAQRAVTDIRALDDELTVQVGGPAAELVDSREALGARVPLAIGVVVLVAGLLLLRLTGSVVVALKTLVLNVLSLAAMLGVVVLVFQHGWGGPLLGGTATGSLDLTTPLLLFMFAFGLSMDYHLFLVARIKEEWDRLGGTREDNTRAVLAGITASGPVVTLAALAVSIVFIGFAAGKLVNVKEVGVGMTVAIVLDVTIVRGLLLPAAMTLLGERNWWRPGLRRRPTSPA